LDISNKNWNGAKDQFYNVLDGLMGLSGTFDAYNFRNLDTKLMPPFANLVRIF